MADKTYIPSLDGLRAVAVGIVILHHVSFRFFPGGGIGVDIFFVLSGYLISNILIIEHRRTHSISFLRFYKNRALRLMPALLFLIFFDLAMALLFYRPTSNEGISALAAITYTMDYLRAFSRMSDLSIVGHTWSLAVEEQFYLIWPCILFLILRLEPKFRILSALSILVFAMLWRAMLLQQGADADRVYYGFDTRADQLLVGCILALWIERGPAKAGQVAMDCLRWLSPLAAVALIALALKVYIPAHPIGGFAFTLTAILAAVPIADLAHRPEGLLSKLLGWSPFVWLGTISYGIYLWHYPVMFLAGYLSHDNQVARMSSVVLAILIAALSRRYIEQPFLRLKDRGPSADARRTPISLAQEVGSSE